MNKAIAGVVVAMFGLCALGADWPQYRGPQADQHSPDKIAKSWPSDGPKVLWRRPVGESFGQIVVQGDRAFFFAGQDDQEAVFAINANTGKDLWSRPLDRTINEREGGIQGPRSTPVIDGNHVYVLGTYLKLACLDAASGKFVWQHDLDKEFAGQSSTGGIKQWGSAQSPIVEGDLVIVAGGGPGQTYLAFNKTTGAVAWKTGTDKITHATATPATIAGVRQIIFFMQSGLVSLAPATGQELWRFKFPFSVSTAASPVVDGDIVYCSAGYGVGGGAAQVTKSPDGKFTATQLWRTPKETINHWSTPFALDGYVYGLFGFKQFRTEPLKCIDIKTGKEIWSHDGFGQGGCILVDGCILIQGDQGQLVLAEATPKGYHELARCQPLSGKCWTMPTLANGRVYTRSTKEAVCLDISK